MRCFILILLLVSSIIEAQKITVIGVGRTGLCLALCLEKAGHEILGVDLSPEYVRKLNEKTFESPEPKVNEFLRASKNFRATASLDEGLKFSNTCFIIVPTNPASVTGEYNCEILDSLLSQINDRKVSGKHVVIISTIFPGYVRNSAVPRLKNCKETTVSYSPIFIAQGDILKGMQFPEIVLIGEGSKEKGEELESIYRSFCLNVPYVGRMSPQSAEIAKMGLNCFVTMKIAFANLIGDIADATKGADKEAILRLLGKDSRIGGKTLMPGYGFGGPCFPRDNRSLGDYANLISIDPVLFRATDLSNLKHAEFMAKKFLEMGLKEYLFEDVCYKSKCPVPIIEESQKLIVAKKIADAGKMVVIKDRAEVIQLVKDQYGDAFVYINAETE